MLYQAASGRLPGLDRRTCSCSIVRVLSQASFINILPWPGTLKHIPGIACSSSHMR